MPSEHLIPVRAGDAAYDVLVRPGLLDGVGARLAVPRPAKAAVVADANVAPLYLDRLLASLRGAGFEPLPVVLPAGEEHKSLEGVLVPALSPTDGAPVRRLTTGR